PCEVVTADGGEAVIRVGGLTHRVAARNARLGPAQLAIRPNAVSLQPRAGGGFPGRVTHSAYLGDHIEYEIETEHGKLFIVDPAVQVALRQQTDVSIYFKAGGLAIINQQAQKRPASPYLSSENHHAFPSRTGTRRAAGACRKDSARSGRQGSRLFQTTCNAGYRNQARPAGCGIDCCQGRRTAQSGSGVGTLPARWLARSGIRAERRDVRRDVARRPE